MSERILSRAEFAERKGVSIATLDRQEMAARRAGDSSFPSRRRIGRGRVGYLESEVDEHLRSLPIGPLTERMAVARSRRKDVLPEAPAARGTEEEGPHVP